MRITFKRVLLNHFFLFAAILFGALALFFDKGYLWLNNDKPFMGFDIEKVQQVYSEKETLVLDALSDCESITDSTKETSRRAFFKYIDHRKLTTHGTFLLVYRNDSLLYWSDNSILVDKKYPTEQFNEPSFQLANGFYTCNRRLFGKYKVIGLIQVSHKYDHNNVFLRDVFQHDFPIPEFVQVSELDFSEDNRVFNYKNEHLFSLIPRSISRSSKPFYYLSVMLYAIVYVLFIIYLNSLVNYMNDYKPSVLWLIPFMLIWLVIRWWMISYKDPAALYSLELFNPQLYGQSFWSYSLGDLLINHLLFFYITYKFHRFFKNNYLLDRLNQIRKPAISLFLKSVMALATLLFFWFIALSFRSILAGLVLNSQISFEVYEILEVNQFTVLGYMIAGIGLAALLTLMDRFAKILHAALHWWMNLCLLVLSLVVAFFSVDINSIQQEAIQLGIIALLMAVLIFAQLWHGKYPYYMYTFIIFLASFFTISVVVEAMDQDDQNTRKTMVQDIANEQDPLAEVLLQSLEDNLRKDPFVKDFLYSVYKKDLNDTKLLYRHLQKKYFKGYLSKYEFKLNICTATDSLMLNMQGNIQTCYDYYTQNIGEILQPGRNFYSQNRENGLIGYFGWIRFQPPTPGKFETSLFLELEAKLITTGQLGYPELLLGEGQSNKGKYEGYQYAKYKNGKLILQVGDYPYKWQRTAYNNTNGEYAFAEMNGYSHLFYNKTDSYTVVLSRKKMDLFDLAVFFAYVFASYYLLLLLTISFVRIRSHISQPKLYFKSRIQISMITMLSISLLLIGGGTLYFNVLQFERKHYDTVREKVQSVINSLENHVGYEHELNQSWHNNKFVNLNELLYQLSNVFFLDINLYSMNGELLATSRPEIFDKGLQSQLMHPSVMKELKVEGKTNFIHKENIGELEFVSAYVPFQNYDNYDLAYVNIPYFARQSELKRELSTLVVALINIYLILILFAIFVTVLISNKITEPLKFIQQSLRDMKLGNRSTIVYTADDEIGSLVREYNNKVKELAESADKLAETEREVAWREMAKQVAHEIKNPLTPMQLSLQLMLRSWRDEDPKFGIRIEKTASTLIEQIGRLSRIATEFSNFAKMPKPINKVFNIVDEVEKISRLFASEDVEFELNIDDYEEVWIYADDEQLARALTNLIKNGIQAIPKETEGKIEVSLFANDEIVRITVRDNGSGIPEEIRAKLFRLNFTTKSSGTGVGLYIVQSIIKGAQGRIWFETEVNVGTTFFIELPIVEKPEQDKK